MPFEEEKDGVIYSSRTLEQPACEVRKVDHGAWIIDKPGERMRLLELLHKAGVSYKNASNMVASLDAGVLKQWTNLINRLLGGQNLSALERTWGPK